MGVSLTVVNAGVSQLVSRGFLEVKPRHGTYVTDYRKNGSIETFASILHYNGGRLNPLEIRNFCETRMAMDPFVAALVIERADKAELIKLQALVLSLEQETDVDAACALEGESAII